VGWHKGERVEGRSNGRCAGKEELERGRGGADGEDEGQRRRGISRGRWRQSRGRSGGGGEEKRNGGLPAALKRPLSLA
jgi:hypothetical protein